MPDSRPSGILFSVADLLGTVALWGGLILAAFGMVAGYASEAILAGSAAGAGLTLLMATHIGRAVVSIAETNAKILHELRKTQERPCRHSV